MLVEGFISFTVKCVRPTMRMIAEKAGVSKNAVSLALRHDPSISLETRQRIEAIAEQIGYNRNPAFGELMSQMRGRGAKSSSSTIALFNGHINPRAFQTHATVPSYVEGCQERAKGLGYDLDELWMHEPDTSGERWCEILRTRGIRGIVIIGLMGSNRLPRFFHPVIESFPCVVTGVRTRQPSLPFVSVDHYILSKVALEQAIVKNYRRPGLVIDGVIDDLVEQRFSSGFRAGQQVLPKSRRLEPYIGLCDGERPRPEFVSWLKKEQPDVIFTLYNSVRRWLVDLGYGIPEDIGLIQLERRRAHSDWAGMDQHNEVSGQMAIDMLIGMIHRGESGVPPFPPATLIAPTWIDGKTIRT